VSFLLFRAVTVNVVASLYLMLIAPILTPAQQDTAVGVTLQLNFFLSLVE
jgi:hypothetical protein